PRPEDPRDRRRDERGAAHGDRAALGPLAVPFCTDGESVALEEGTPADAAAGRKAEHRAFAAGCPARNGGRCGCDRRDRRRTARDAVVAEGSAARSSPASDKNAPAALVRAADALNYQPTV